ncbi:hypothetical protein BGZ96_003789 [Linnemannia gamsii]|uniref:HMG box domain-containing protein n=1 Tax=Linnemannia gamsii TaxID=64522 RepID=A0ABQ7K785_9FUNG|nr:hypothetical protein BGZ96_003789 [Linnemannia gamsii]
MFAGFGPKSKRPASMIESERQHSFSSHLHPHKRTTLPRTSARGPLSLSTPLSSNVLIDTAIPDEPSLESVDNSHSIFISSALGIPLKSTPSTQSTTIIAPTSSETCLSKSKSTSCPTESSTSSSPYSPSSSFSASQPSSSKRLIASGSASTRPLQFINKSGPPAPRQKPQQPTGVYVQTVSAKQQKARKKIREEGKVKRSSNCFIMYRTDVHPIIVANFGHQNNKEISRLAGRWWRSEQESVKNFYRTQAAEEKVRHATLYPSYKYTPAKPGFQEDGNANSAKSKARRPLNKSIQLSPPPAKCSPPPVKCSSPSDLNSPLPSLHEPESIKDSVVRSAEDASTEYSLSPRVIERNKSANSVIHSNSTSKLPTERGFVVTETALFDFKGNADLSEKKKKLRSRTGSRSNQLNQRLPVLVEPLSPNISMAHAPSITNATQTSPFTFVLQRPGVPNASLPAGSKRVSRLTKALAHERSDSQAVTSSMPALPRTPASEAPPGWSTMAGQLQVSGTTPQQPVPQSSPVLHSHTLHTVFQGNSIASVSNEADQNWAQQLSPQPAPPFLTRLATNFVHSPQPSVPIQISVPPSVTATSQFSSSFDSPMYTPTVPSSANLGMDGFPWQLDTNLSGTSDFSLLYTSGSLSTTPPTPSSTPMTTMHFQQGISSLSPVDSHPALAHLTLTTVPSFEDDFTSGGFEQELSSSLVPDDIFDDTTWNRSFQMPSPNVADLDQQLLLSASTCTSSLSLSIGSIYPDIAISAWTTLGEPLVPSPEFISNDNSPSLNNSSRNDINICDDNDSSCNSCTDIHDGGARVNSINGGSVETSQVITVASQAASVGGQPLTWGDEEHLKMSISYFEDIVQKQKMLLSLQRQWRQQAQVVQSPATSALALRMEM